MLIKNMNWMQVEEYLKKDDRVILPLGSTEQHAYLSLMTDAILAEKVSEEAAEPLGIPVMPVMPYGMAPYFCAYPGTVSLKPATYFAIVRDLLDNLYRSGFRRILVVNGHGGNSPILGEIQDWLATHEGARVKLHNWWNAPRTLAKVTSIDPVASHASWMENFPWTRLTEVVMPTTPKTMIRLELNRQLSGKAVRAYAGDGNYGGCYEKDEKAMLEMWQIGVAETRTEIEENWAP